jgi:hypothetical protein
MKSRKNTTNTVPAFLQGLLTAMETMPAAEYQEPKKLIQEGEDFIGLLPNRLKALGTIRAVKMDKVDDLEARFGSRLITETSRALVIGGDLNERMSQPFAELDNERDELEVINQLFWLGIKKAFPKQCAKAALEKRVLGIRKWWQIVAKKSEVKTMVLDLSLLSGLASLFGEQHNSPMSSPFADIFGGLDKHPYGPAEFSFPGLFGAGEFPGGFSPSSELFGEGGPFAGMFPGIRHGRSLHGRPDPSPTPTPFQPEVQRAVQRAVEAFKASESAGEPASSEAPPATEAQPEIIPEAPTVFAPTDQSDFADSAAVGVSPETPDPSETATRPSRPSRDAED